MKNAQKIKEKSVDMYNSHPGAEHFDIQQDQGKLYVPGQSSVHAYFEILYCQCNNGAEFMVEGEKILLQRGDILVIKPDMIHGFASYGKTGEDYLGYSVRVSQEFAWKIVKDYTNQGILFEKYKHVWTRGTLWDRIDQLFLMAVEELRQKAPGWENALFGCALMLLTQVGRAASVDPNEGSRLEKGELLNNILTYVEANLGEKITLEDTASKFFVSASTVTQLFNKK